MAELCKKLQKKIEFNLGQRFGPLDCEKNIESIIQLLKANNLYDKATTSCEFKIVINLGLTVRNVKTTSPNAGIVAESFEDVISNSKSRDFN